MAYSARFRAHLTGSATVRWRTWAEMSNDGSKTWKTFTVESGTVTVSSKSQTRWSVDLVAKDVDASLAGINPYSTRMRIRQGLVLSDYEEPEWVSLGVYQVKSTQTSTQDPSRVTVNAVSFEDVLIRSTLPTARTLPAQPVQAALEGLVREVLPAAQFIWDADVNRQITIPFAQITDRWATIDGSTESKSFAQALGARVYHDENGFWRIDSIASLNDQPTWFATEGPDGVQIYATDQQTNDGVSNIEVVYGTPAGGGVLGPFIARDDDPASLTYVGRTPDDGGFGQIPAPEYRTPFVVTNEQGMNVARQRLAMHRGLRRQLGGEFHHDPTLRPDMVGQIQTLDGAVTCILDALTFDIGPTPGNMTAEIRLQGQSYDGRVVDQTADDQ